MREIKFRAFFKGWTDDPDFNEEEYNKSEKMLYDAQNVYDGCGIFSFPFHTCFGEVLEDDNCVVMQYTGLKDAYGMEIYEGDIVAFSTDFKTDVIFYDGCYMIDNGHLQLYRCHNACKVIGNIYENPELLSK